MLDDDRLDTRNIFCTCKTLSLYIHIKKKMKKIRTSAIPSCSYYFYTHPHIHTYCPMYTHFFPFCYFLVFLFQHTHTRTYTLYVSDIHAYIHFIFKIFYAQVTYMHCYCTYYIFYKHVLLGDMEICATEKIFR